MSHFQRMTHDDGDTSLWLSVCTVPAADAVVDASGHTPNGYFWNGVAERLFEGPLAAVAARLQTDPEGDTFVARSADGAALDALEAAMNALLNDPDALRELIESADADGFDFDD